MTDPTAEDGRPAFPPPFSERGASGTAYPEGSRKLFGEHEIRRAVSRLGGDVRSAYEGQELTVVAVLHGAMVFTADLIRELDMPVFLETVTASSYRGEATRPGDLEVRMESAAHLRGRHVLLVDDILDTGRTLCWLRSELERYEPHSLRIAALLDKPSRRVEPVRADFVGFEIPDEFVVGYGLDYDGRYRNLPDILALNSGGHD